MRKLATVVLGGMLILSTPASAVAQTPSSATTDPAEIAEARVILAIMFPPAEREATFNKIGAAFAEQFRNSIPKAAFADPALRAIVDEAMNRSIEVQKPVLAKH